MKKEKHDWNCGRYHKQGYYRTTVNGKRTWKPMPGVFWCESKKVTTDKKDYW